ncbi:MAG: CARDB domain-containing protein [Opitutaceae bacterium]
MTRVFSLLALCISSLALLLTGCQSQIPTQVTDSGYTAPQSKSVQATQWKAAKTSKPVAINAPQYEAKRVEAAPIKATKSSDVIFKTNQISVTKTILEAASVGGNLKYRIAINALDDVSTVRVTETMPTGVQFVSASPSPRFAGSQKPNWEFPSMSKGQTQNIDVTVKPIAEGDHRICSTVSVDNAFCLDLFSGQPKLSVVKKGPSSIELGEVATWTVTVNNSGSAEATNVTVTDNLPDAFEATTELSQNVGTIAPGETKTVSYSAKAVKQGDFTNRAVANYDGGPAIGGQSSAPITVVQSGIRVRKVGPAEAYVFKPVTFDITIENTGDTDLKNVRITDILPKGTSVSDNGKGRVSGDAIGWMIPNLPAGASQLIRTEVAATRKGSSTNKVKVVTANGLEASDEATTNWLAVPGVTVSITDSKDPIRVREATTYSIQVKNQGDFEPVGGAVTVTFNDSIKPISVSGDAQGTINGQTVTFPRTTLEPGKDTNLTITTEGAQIGPGRAAMSFSADFLSDPIISQETTNVY